MRTPDYVDAPFAVHPMVRDDATVHLESDGVAHPDYMRLVEPDGKELIIPARLLNAILATGNRFLMDMARDKDEAKVLFNHPSHFATLDFVKDNKRQLVLEGASADIELTPLIAWLAEPGKEPGWRLSIVGANSVRLMFAQWDDVENIKKMVETINNPESLFVMVSLKDPTLASKLASRSAAVNMKKTRVIPKMEIKELRKIVENAQLQMSGVKSWFAGGFGNLPIKINGSEVRVAIKVHLPATPMFATPFVKDEALDSTAQNAAHKVYEKETRDEWMRRFKAAIQETDWRIVDLRDSTKNNNYRNALSDFWVTKISEKDWANLEVAAMAEAQTRNGTPAKF